MKGWIKENVFIIVSGLIAVSLTGAVIYLALSGLEVPEVLASGAGMVWGFFFGSEVRRRRGE